MQLMAIVGVALRRPTFEGLHSEPGYNTVNHTREG
jgi:hypothetical protein